MVMLLNQTITAALSNQLSPVLQVRGGTGGTQLPSNITIQLNFTYGSGGTNVNAWLQTSLDGETTWSDVVGFATLTTSSSRASCNISSSVALAQTAATDGTLTQNTLNNGLFGNKWRVKWTSTGTYAGNTKLRIDAHTNGLILAPSSGGI